MATYKVILNGVKDGLDVSEVAPRLGFVCKIPAKGAMALLASPGMVIKRGLDQETAATYEAALRSVGCKALVEQETGANNTTAPLVPQTAKERGRGAPNAQAVRQHLNGLAQTAKNTVAAAVQFAQRYAAQAGKQRKSAKPATGASNSSITGLTQAEAINGPTPAITPKAKKSLRAIPLMIAGVAVATVAIAGFFSGGSSSTGGPCPGEYNVATWTNCVGEVNFPDGGKYIGEVKDGEPNGQGTFTWSNGEKYVGEWTNGRRNGRGTFTWPDGEKYVGEFKNNKKHGQGTFTYANGRKYVGEFKDGNPTQKPRDNR